MTLTLTADIDDTVQEMTVTGTVSASIVPGSYRFRLSSSDEVMDLVGFGPLHPTRTWPVDRNRWLIHRHILGTTATAHTNGATVQAVVDEFVASSDETAPDPVDSGPGGGGGATLAGVYSFDQVIPNDGVTYYISMTALYDPDSRLVDGPATNSDIAFPEAPPSNFPVDAGLIVTASGYVTYVLNGGGPTTQPFQMEWGGGDFTNRNFTWQPIDAEPAAVPITLVDSYEEFETFELGVIIPDTETGPVRIAGRVLISIGATWP